ncbi:FHA domain-containing protein [Microbacterium sp. EYE_5]|uniref:FHA domain-containing protein FhaB/FipA n=1 Tax=unclassified Microbacterium TaxID=2609290 RepID=UPI002005DED8|nr:MULTISPECIES: FHA domain-containing protein [unclassified Microbacterium]MCK6079613.1 FHA domain-containing protein [Microbacterium sp. EYE_382]MCK6084884.1 FHA domain-containing protein [Microbacterium sp. EYE_384]MCK6122890.1 FHA domain-containing protein [Microbacterium sp. EYE_80]MCK6125647.1 FHA domain-containing protein [Microbacterium sp. EYE_79]MCK6140568.1 FHA domain-containing protein [Microbacterium sp. EYE_39]
MSELTLLLLQVGFLILLWFFVFAVVYSLRADLFGVKVRKMPEPATAAPGPIATAPANAETSIVTPVTPRASAPSGPQKATVNTVARIVITSGPKAGLELPLGDEPLTIGRSSESGLVIRDDYTSSHHARLVLWGEQWMLQDLDSTNGTWHDGQRVASPVPIVVGAPIKVGATTFELRK